MNKKGFTIVELVVSIVILSIVVIFMLSLMNQLRDKEEQMEDMSDMTLNTAFISKKINGDILRGYGIKTISCTNTICNITLNNDDVKTLSISNNRKTLTYSSEDRIELARTLPRDDASYRNISVYENNLAYGTVRVVTIGIDNYPNNTIELVDY